MCLPVSAGVAPTIKNAKLTEYAGKPVGKYVEDGNGYCANGWLDGEPAGGSDGEQKCEAGCDSSDCTVYCYGQSSEWNCLRYTGTCASKKTILDGVDVSSYTCKKKASHLTTYYPEGLEYHCDAQHTLSGDVSSASKITTKVNAQGFYTPALPTECIKIGFTLQGRVLNARDGTSLDGVKITVEGTGITATASSGFFALLNVPVGSFLIKYEVASYISNARPVNVTGDIAVGGVMDINMAPLMNADEWRAVIKWSDYPLDLDTFGFWGSSKTCWYQKDQYGGNMQLTLEVDRTQGYGPETLYYKNVGSCTGSSSMCDIRYSIHDYTETGHMYDDSKAEVTLYTGERIAVYSKSKTVSLR
jgi:hypothetical protein